MKKWPAGIPKYNESDLMTEEDKLIFAMNIIMEYELSPNGYKVIEINRNPKKHPNYVCEKDGKLIFIIVKCDVAPITPTMNIAQMKRWLEHAEKFEAECYFAAVSIGATDAERFEASLALKNDSYYINYKGLETISYIKRQMWIQRAKRQIADLIPEESNIRYSSRQVHLSLKESYEKWEGENDKKTFQELLLQYIQEKNMTNQEFYKAAFIDRKLFSAIYNNKSYHPNKETVVACCFGLKLNIDESEKLIESAGYSLSMSICWDRVVFYCIKNEMYDIFAVNELLYEHGEKCIRV